MRSASLVGRVLVVALFLLAIPVAAQPPPGNPPSPPSGAGTLLFGQSLQTMPQQEPGEFPAEPEFQCPSSLVPTSPASGSETASAPGCWREARFEETWLPEWNGNRLQINDFEAKTTLAFLLVDGWAPLTLNPGLGAHFWEGPSSAHSPPAPGLPSNLYDAYLDIGWRPQPARWLFLDLVVTPGLYRDLKQLDWEAFQLRGRAVAIVACSPQFQLAGGALYGQGQAARGPALVGPAVTGVVDPIPPGRVSAGRMSASEVVGG